MSPNNDITNLKKDFQVSNIQNQGIMHETETRKNGLLVEIRFFRLIISRLGVILNIHPQEYWSSWDGYGVSGGLSTPGRV